MDFLVQALLSLKKVNQRPKFPTQTALSSKVHGPFCCLSLAGCRLNSPPLGSGRQLLRSAWYGFAEIPTESGKQVQFAWLQQLKHHGKLAAPRCSSAPQAQVDVVWEAGAGLLLVECVPRLHKTLGSSA